MDIPNANYTNIKEYLSVDKVKGESIEFLENIGITLTSNDREEILAAQQKVIAGFKVPVLIYAMVVLVPSLAYVFLSAALIAAAKVAFDNRHSMAAKNSTTIHQDSSHSLKNEQTLDQSVKPVVFSKPNMQQATPHVTPGPQSEQEKHQRPSN